MAVTYTTPNERQLSTILAVELESDVPVWFFGMAVRQRERTREFNKWDTHMIPTSSWLEEDRDYFTKAAKEALPPSDGSRRVYRDVHPYSIEYRMKMTPEEQKFICDPKWGARTIDDVKQEILEAIKD